MSWEVEYTDEFAAWWETLTAQEQERVSASVVRVQEQGPALGRPWVDTIKTSRYPNMKELRTRGGHIRVLFAFDPRRTALLLLGGDKTGRWTAWYEQMVPLADRLYDDHLAALKREGDLP